ncbi:methylated-DNA--[protein]-cysteine S-methyltransferase [Apibacter raozihei]|uniref:methylated-DNA--[protein]-cysteine S-methyltransferase n=1 Tax=Apibacter raozihei TaxID=2500547 RepID=UPI000FE35E34|nr:methylated-DNA--[protein]-cysteine S-methyltransferase [Apibacter raozihei]
MNIINIQHFNSTFGELVIGSFNNQLCLCDWRYRKRRESIDLRIKKFLKAEYKEDSSQIIEATIQQLVEYSNKERTSFELPLLLCGTDFQKSVWEELNKVAYGKTETYLGLAKKMKNEKGIRAIASANGANAISIIIPCHRIIGSNRELIGYAGGLPIKKQLLAHESPTLQTSLF